MTMQVDYMKERKIINITGKRQITIPLRFYEKLDFGKEIECVLTDDALILRPLKSADDGFVMEILRDLVSQGYNGEKLLEQFDKERQNIKKAFYILQQEAEDMVSGKIQAITSEDVFGDD